MKQRAIGKCGLEVSLVGLGCNNFGGRSDFEETKAVIHKAFDLDITFFDTAPVYPRFNAGKSEEFMGRILGDRRKDIVLATKFGVVEGPEPFGRGSRHNMMREVEASLRRLKTDWIDLYQLHLPDANTPIEETLRAFDDLIRQGKVRYIGCSNFQAWQAVEAEWTAKHLGLNGFVSCQSQYSLLNREVDRELMGMLEAYGWGFLPFFPLASGLLTGKYKRGEAPGAGTRFGKAKMLADRFLTEANWDIVERLDKFAADRGHTLLELSFSWLASRPAVWSIIAGATTPEQLEANVEAVNWALTEADLTEIDEITGKPVRLLLG